MFLMAAHLPAGVAPGGGAWLGGQLFSAMCVSTFLLPPCLFSILCILPVIRIPDVAGAEGIYICGTQRCHVKSYMARPAKGALSSRYLAAVMLALEVARVALYASTLCCRCASLPMSCWMS